MARNDQSRYLSSRSPCSAYVASSIRSKRLPAVTDLRRNRRQSRRTVGTLEIAATREARRKKRRGPMNRTQRSAWNLAAGLAFALTSAAGSLFSTPLLLRWLGAERLGAFKAITGWIGFLTFFELGLGGAMMAALAVIGQYNQAAI